MGDSSWGRELNIKTQETLFSKLRQIAISKAILSLLNSLKYEHYKVAKILNPSWMTYERGVHGIKYKVAIFMVSYAKFWRGQDNSLPYLFYRCPVELSFPAVIEFI